eukprot:scaffold7433_cov1327-Pinguiococcus_pyrenoidosus.AAC.1
MVPFKGSRNGWPWCPVTGDGHNHASIENAGEEPHTVRSPASIQSEEDVNAVDQPLRQEQAARDLE